ncbi:HAD family phosphatase [Streptomyces sp. SKN60]|uniref:HAD family hydrolase n=1 Tax=Streptomyces sp. SKN60 TaxID=2855506 RepID=UPI0022456C05|nr:HAD family phosphatase [Streptomyces sp. SKN60]
MRPEVIFFDLGDVVCRFHPERRLGALADACGLGAGEVRHALYESGLVGRWDRGLASAAEIHATLERELGYTGGPAALHELWCTAFEPDDRVLALVDGLRPLRTALLTNNDALLLEALPEVLPQVAARFEPLLFSCMLGATKPDPAAYTRALDLVGVAPEAAVFIDDKPSNVAGARAVGITALHFTGAAELSTAVAELLAAGP